MKKKHFFLSNLFCTHHMHRPFFYCLLALSFSTNSRTPTPPAVSLKNTYSIMIDTAGDEHYAGRIIDNTFERGLCQQYAQALKEEIEQQIPSCTVLLMRTLSQSGGQLTRATIANRRSVDLYLSIHFFQESGIKPTISIYQFSYQDEQLPLSPGLAFYPFDQAHRISCTQTSNLIKTLNATFLNDEYKKIIDAKKPIRLPFAPLAGITAPAAGIEIGLIYAHDWRQFVKPITQAVLQHKAIEL